MADVYLAVEISDRKQEEDFTVSLSSILSLELNGQVYKATTPLRILSNYAGALRGFGEPASLSFSFNKSVEAGILKFSVPLKDKQYLKKAYLVWNKKREPLKFEIFKEDAFMLLPSAVYGK